MKLKMDNNYKLTIPPIVKDDLRVIYQYGRLNWGEAKASDYIDNVKIKFWSLTEHPEIGIKQEALLPDLRSLIVNKHIIFYRIKKQQIEIIRVLHARQDPQRHLI